MKYASESGGMSTSVHDWKPTAPDNFTRLLHQYSTQCSDEHGHEGLTTTAMKLDQTSTATIFYMPKGGKAPDVVRSPVLMSVAMSDGKVICFESLKYGNAADWGRVSGNNVATINGELKGSISTQTTMVNNLAKIVNELSAKVDKYLSQHVKLTNEVTNFVGTKQR